MNMKRKFLVGIIILVAILILFFFVHLICTYRASICDSKVELTELLGMDFLDTNIVDIQYENFWEWDIGDYTYIYVYLDESDEMLQSREYYRRENYLGDWSIDEISPGDIENLEKVGISVDDIQCSGINYKETSIYHFYPLKFSGWHIPYEICWFQLKPDHRDRENVILLSIIPRKIIVKVDRVMKN